MRHKGNKFSDLFPLCTTLTAVYLWGANLIKSGIGSKTNYYLYNAHGDVIQLTNTTGAVIRNYTYDAFGNEDDPDITDTNPFRYCGEYYDRESKTYYLRARYYDPALGRFTQQDTHWNPENMIYGDDPQKNNEREDKLGLNTYTMVPQITAIAQSGNLYGYCVGNPLRYRDLSGYQIELFVPDAVPIGTIYTGFPLEDIWKDLLEFGGIICAYFLLSNEKTGVIDFADGEGKTEKPSDAPKTVDDVLKDATPGRKTKGRAKQYDKNGGYEKALEDFGSLGLNNVKEEEDGTLVGDLPDGRKVNVRDHSKEGSPTLEIRDPRTKKSIKIRYK